MKVWSVSKLNKELANEISQYFDIPVFTAMLLALRGVEVQDAQSFLSDDIELYDPFLAADMQKAASRILTAIKNKEKICVYGDYDADGVTATALLYSHLKYIGADVCYRIPSRENDGYGLNLKAIDELEKVGINLIVTVDNGISAIKEIEYALSKGIETVVTDHHTPPDELPKAVANVDLHRADCPSLFKELSGVGIAFKLVMALSPDIELERLLNMYSDLVCIGTVGDIVSLNDENRAFVKAGLAKINKSDRLGIKAIKSIAGLNNKPITAGNVSFAIVPRINAIGRLDNSELSVELLLAENEAFAKETAELLDNHNKLRQSIEKDIFTAAVKMIESNKKIKHSRVIVIEGEGWHVGVIGIVASKLKDLYSKPVIVISKEDGISKGSGRSVKGFSLVDAIFKCSQYLDKYGGHSMAAGLSIKNENIDIFRNAINAYAQSLDELPYNTLQLDCKLNPLNLDIDMVYQLKMLEPFGAGNPMPVFGLYNMRLKSVTPISSDKHLKLTLSREETEISAMLFSTSSGEFPFEPGDILDLAVTLDINEYLGNQSLSIVVKGCKLSSINQEEYAAAYRVYEKFMRGETLTVSQINTLMPTRDEFATVYRYIRKIHFCRLPIDVLTAKIGDEAINCGRLSFILRCMSQLGLIRLEEKGDTVLIELTNTNGKVDLENAKALIYLRNMLKQVITMGGTL